MGLVSTSLYMRLQNLLQAIWVYTEMDMVRRLVEDKRKKASEFGDTQHASFMPVNENGAFTKCVARAGCYTSIFSISLKNDC